MTLDMAEKPTRHRRVVMLLIFVCVAITFLDRGNISLTAPISRRRQNREMKLPTMPRKTVDKDHRIRIAG